MKTKKSLFFDSEKSNLGGLSKLRYMYVSDIKLNIESVGGNVRNIVSASDFIPIEFVLESGKFKEKKKDVNIFEYDVKCEIAYNEYAKFKEISRLDNNKAILLVTDNNGFTRLLGDRENGCIIKIESNIDAAVSSLNSYKLSCKWLSRFRAPFADGIVVGSSHYEFEDNINYEFENTSDFYDFND